MASAVRRGVYQYCSLTADFCARPFGSTGAGVVVVVWRPILVQRRVVNCTSPSDGRGCGEIVCEGAWLEGGPWGGQAGL